MARHLPTDPEVRPVVDQLVSVFLSEGSVAGVQRALGNVLAKDRAEGWLHPNRLHALLSEDPARAVHTQTLQTVRLALSRLQDQVGQEQIGDRTTEYRASVSAAWDRHSKEQVPDPLELVQRVADDVGLPPAVVRRLLPEAAYPSVPPVTAEGAYHRQPGRRQPDWSYQDHAYEACLASLRKGPNRKVGLILPTGAGKTRVAIRISLRVLADSDRSDSVVVWVTHRTWLAVQARRELQRVMTDGTRDLPEDAVSLLADRVRIVKLAQLAKTLDELGERVALVVVDEAHHAAAPSYQPIFDQPLRGLFLTATPNRTDQLPIGIDEIAFTITYRELFKAAVIVEPTFEQPLILSGIDRNELEDLRELADYVLDRAENDFVKTLVVTTRTDTVERLHEVFVDQLSTRHTHVLGPDDIGFVHGGASSTGSTPDEFLDEFTSNARPRGILLTTSSLLGEGFDDPAMNAVVVTYPTSSMIQLMQAAGRCLRYAPAKKRAFIVQVQESSLAYHYEQRWLYQDISDLLHPQLLDYSYNSAEDLFAQLDALLASHRVATPVAEAARAALQNVQAGENVSFLLTGLPYYGAADEFATTAPWNVVPVTEATRSLFLRVFNDFSGRGADVNQFTDYLRNYIPTNPSQGSTWKLFIDMLAAMDHARRELTGEPYANAQARGYLPSQGTTWLLYVTFSFRPTLPPELGVFLLDALNRESCIASYTQDPPSWRLAVKVALPLIGTWGYLLDGEQRDWFLEQREQLRTTLQQVQPQESFAAMMRWRLANGAVPVPQLLVERFDNFISEAAFTQHALTLR